MSDEALASQHVSLDLRSRRSVAIC